MKKFPLALLVLLLAAGGMMWIWSTTAPEALVIDQARVRLAPGNGPQAGYFILQNHTRHPVRLQAASSETFERVMMHQTRIDNGQSSMQSLDNGILVGVGESIEFTPGGMHLMLMRGKQALQVGDTVSIALQFVSLGDESQTHTLNHDFVVVPLAP